VQVQAILCSSSGVSICSSVIVKQVNWVTRCKFKRYSAAPQVICSFVLVKQVNRVTGCISSGVSICSFVLVKEVNWVSRSAIGFKRCQYLYFCTSKANEVSTSSSGVSICNFALVKQVNWVPRSAIASKSRANVLGGSMNLMSSAWTARTMSINASPRCVKKKWKNVHTKKKCVTSVWPHTQLTLI
jgi:hypothetical protein